MGGSFFWDLDPPNRVPLAFSFKPTKKRYPPNMSILNIGVCPRQTSTQRQGRCQSLWTFGGKGFCHWFGLKLVPPSTYGVGPGFAMSLLNVGRQTRYSDVPKAFQQLSKSFPKACQDAHKSRPGPAEHCQLMGENIHRSCHKTPLAGGHWPCLAVSAVTFTSSGSGPKEVSQEDPAKLKGQQMSQVLDP